MNDIDIQKLKELLEEHDMKHKDLCEILNLTQAKVSHIMVGRRKISDSEQKLLKLYFYGIMPFDLLAPSDGYTPRLDFTPEEWRILDIMAKRNGFTDTTKWIVAHIREYLAYCESQYQAEPENITPMPKKKANILAAAGSGIEADIIDWDGSSPTLNVGVYGLSMLGSFDDGDVITMTHKSQSRSPYMKKGLVYLVEMDGKMLIKEFGTRKARPDEHDADYLNGHGMVGILKSHNPNKTDFPDIDITQPIEWIAWYDPKSNK